MAKEFSGRKTKRWRNGSGWGMSGTKSGKRADLNNRFFRSSWEANYARYLNWMVCAGQIKSWSYEVETFEFSKIKRGTRFYTPDFKVMLLDNEIEYHEVKGWKHPKGETALKRMAKYYPNIKIKIIDKDVYKPLEKVIGGIIPNWEFPVKKPKVSKNAI